MISYIISPDFGKSINNYELRTVNYELKINSVDQTR